MHSSHVSKSTPTVTLTTTSESTTTTVTFSGFSRPESAVGQRQQGAFMGLLTTPHTPAESTEISSTCHQQDELGPLSEMGTTQIAPFEVPATHQTVTFDDQDQGQSASSLSISNEPSRSQKSSQPVDDLVVPIVREEQGPNPTDKWIMMSGDKKRPFQCAHKRCARKYSTKAHLQAHFATHTGDSKLRCYFGDCAGTFIYRDVRELTRHTRAHHTFEKPLSCELCDKRFRLQHHLKYHIKHVHGIEEKKKSSKQYSVSKSSSAAATTTTASTITNTFGNSQPESAPWQRQQGSFMGLLTTPHTPAESTEISSTCHQQDELGPLSEMGTTQIAPFEVPATHQTVTFDDQDQGQSASSLSISNEPSRSQKSPQPVDNVVAPIVREEPSLDPTDKWIVMSGDKKRPFQCGHKSCAKKYSEKAHLQTHFVTHTGDSKLRCYLGDCAGIAIYPDVRTLTRHTRAYHTFEKPFLCKRCNRRYRRPDYLKYHMEHVHSLEKEKKPQSVYKSSTAASTIAITSGNIQTESVRPRSSSVGLSTLHTPESRQIPTDYPQQAGLRLLAEVSTSQISPFAALATHQTVTFEDEAVTTTGIARDPNLPGVQHLAEQSPDPTDEWIIVDKFQERPYICGYPGCDMRYKKKSHLRGHFFSHTGTSKFKCPHPDCVGNEYFRDNAMLKRHIAAKHTLDKPFQCDMCDKRFSRKDHLKLHRKNMHGIK